MINNYDMKFLAEAGYTMGLQTIREVTRHMEYHHYAYFNTEQLGSEIERLYAMIGDRLDDPITKYVTPERMKEMDEELDKVLNAPIADGDKVQPFDEDDFKRIMGDKDDGKTS